jgi:hypothetical protein
VIFSGVKRKLLGVGVTAAKLVTILFVLARASNANYSIRLRGGGGGS